jgi:hypothetical protein
MGNSSTNENVPTVEKVITEELPREKEKPGERQYKEGLISLSKKDFGEAMVFFQAADELGKTNNTTKNFEFLK